MDIISLSKANRVRKEKESYQKNKIGEGVEAHFKSLDERLDYLEGAGSIPNLTELVQLLKKDAVMINTEFEGDVLKLKYVDLTHATYKKDYVSEGIYEKLFDLSGSYVATQLITITKAAAANQDVIIEFSTSEDNTTYSAFALLTSTSQFERYVHLRITLKNDAKITISYDYTPTLEEASRIKNNLLITEIQSEMDIESSWDGEGTLFKINLDQFEILRIDKVEVN